MTRVEEIKRMTVEHFDRRKKLFEYMAALTDEEIVEFDPWWKSYIKENRISLSGMMLF